MAVKKSSKRKTPKKRTPPPQEDTRIYVVVPHTVQVTQGRGTKQTEVTKVMEPGRLMAQVAHVVSKMRTSDETLAQYGSCPITTIVLSVRNSRELAKVWDELYGPTLASRFYDENPDFYGTSSSVLTAVCTFPATRSDVEHALGHLELYEPLR